ncbi:hypothetical protein P691DRAFT_657724 [Macrolepiota fuliginosa MF-IS2]|uniref:Uncharacterized protein n=1 Tax=Macrolepiota fuliginosa MF-IS2 TaxID=1400762 RepID=A0A9P6C6P9_9AGAR|nr:hypothetical protein P691DRAFT_657724 [Macrolepiota fuliginosa MF-IS2]
MDTPEKPSSSQFPTAKITAFARLKTLTDTITFRQRNRIIFPPPSWEIDNLAVDSKNGWDQTQFSPPSKSPSREEAVARVAETIVSTEVPTNLEPEKPEPLSFAQRIRELIESLPFPSTTSSVPRPPAADAPDISVLRAEDGTIGPPVPPGVDRELVQLLSSEEVMNGDEGNEKAEQQSIWSVLSKMRWKGRGKDLGGQQQSSGESTEDGLMMYAPLEPTKDSEVEMAEMRSVPEVPNGSYLPVPEQPKEDVEWMPSTTQISVYATWWGYRLYLPPSVMATLDSASLMATAQAAMITGALKWLLGKLPSMLVPAQFKPAVAMMKTLAPVAGYIGVFIAWSWNRIKSHDKGNGVALTATWILPVALIPMAWDAGDIYGPVLLPKPEDRIPPPSQQEQKSDKEQETKKKKGFWHL